jgi:putative transposase
VFVSPSTWRRLIRERGWIWPRHRVYPAKPKEGIRASKPNEYWHIDVTVIKLLDGTRTYLHAVIDNFSRRILAWKLAPRLEPQGTCLVLIEAGKNLLKNGDGATVIADSGIENVNGEVDDLFRLGQLHRILAQVRGLERRHLRTDRCPPRVPSGRSRHGQRRPSSALANARVGR